MQAYTQANLSLQRSAIRPMVPICLMFMGGIIVAKYFLISLTLLIFLLLLLISICSIAIARNKHNQISHYISILILAIAFLIGIIRTEVQIRDWLLIQQNTKSIFFEREHKIQGLIEDIRTSNSTTKVTLDNIVLNQDKQETYFPGKIELILPEDRATGLEVGQQILTNSTIVPIWGTSVPTGMDWLNQRYSNQIYGSVYIDNNTEFKLLDGRTFQWRSLSHQAIASIQQTLPQHEFLSEPEEIMALISSIAFGIRSDMPAELQVHLQRSGLAHITSISGLHVTFVLCFIFFLLKWIGLKRKQAAWATFIVGVIYLLMVGIRIPTLRAVMMAFVLFGQFIVQRRSNSLNTLALVALIILLLNPMELFLPSFQLSFAAVLFLILYSPLFAYIENSRLPKTIKWFCQGVSASAIVTMGLAPFIIYYFHYFSWGAILGNLIAIFILFLFLPLVYVWVMLISVPGLSNCLGFVVGVLGSCLIEIIHFFGSNNIFSLDVSTPPVWFSIFGFISMMILSQPLLIWFTFNQINIKSIHIALLLMAVSFWIHPLVRYLSPLQVHFLALGQGDCTFIQTPNGKTILVDGGPKPTKLAYGQNPYLVDFLKHQGVNHIDVMVLTHPQSDHIGALIHVIDEFKVVSFIEGIQSTQTKHYLELRNKLETKNIKQIQVKTGDQIHLDQDLSVWILHPDEQAIQTHGDVNEASVVMLLQYKQSDILLAGDIGTTTEKILVDRFDNWDVDLLKVPHHGSRYSTSEAMLNETLPEYGVVQVGRNPYGHPHSDTQYRLYQNNSQVIRTDYDGTVQIKTWGDDLRIYTTKSNKLFIHKLE